MFNGKLEGKAAFRPAVHARVVGLRVDFRLNCPEWGPGPRWTEEVWRVRE